jgi:hypothetical protein
MFDAAYIIIAAESRGLDPDQGADKFEPLPTST